MVLVVDKGRLLQAGPRAEVFARPASPQVARLLGIPNLIHATVSEPGVLLARWLVARPRGGGLAADTGGLAVGAEVPWTIRPDHIAVAARGDGSAGGAANDEASGGATRRSWRTSPTSAR